MTESKIGIIVSSIKLAELAKKVANQTQVYSCSLETAIPIGRELQEKGIEVIISLGGTAAILGKNLSIPVLAIPFTAFDLIENVVEAFKHGKNIGICLYDNPISKIEIFEHILGVKIKQIIYHDLETLRIGILQAKKEGIEAVIGGNSSCQIAQEVGLPSVLISSTPETVANVIEEAKKICKISVGPSKATYRIFQLLQPHLASSLQFEHLTFHRAFLSEVYQVQARKIDESLHQPKNN